MDFLIKLDTNGNLPDILKDLVNEKLIDYVAMDVKTTLKKYKELAGEMTNPSAIAESVEFLKQGNVNYEFRTTIVKEIHNDEILEKMKLLLAGSDKYFLQSFRSGNTLDEKFSCFSPLSKNKMQELKKEFSKNIKIVGIR